MIGELLGAHCYLLTCFGIVSGAVALIALACYWSYRVGQRLKKEIAQAQVLEEELTIDEVCSRWLSTIPTPPPFTTGSSGYSSEMQAMAWQEYAIAMEHYVRSPESHYGWYEHSFTTEEYPAFTMSFTSRSRIEKGWKVKVKLWKHSRNGTLLRAEVLWVRGLPSG